LMTRGLRINQGAWSRARIGPRLNRAPPRQGIRRYEDRRRVAAAPLNGVILSRVWPDTAGRLAPEERRAVFRRRPARTS
jgi:hypothetical protein